VTARKHKLRHASLALVLPLAMTACGADEAPIQSPSSGSSVVTVVLPKVQPVVYYAPVVKTVATMSTTAIVEFKIRTTWAGTGQADRAVAIARCESGLSPVAKNRGSTASGVFQLLRQHWAGKFNPYDPSKNIEYAHRLWKSSGWRPWVCKGSSSSSKRHKTHKVVHRRR
jgi:hypothetical protein